MFPSGLSLGLPTIAGAVTDHSSRPFTGQNEYHGDGNTTETQRLHYTYKTPNEHGLDVPEGKPLHHYITSSSISNISEATKGKQARPPTTRGLLPTV